MRKGFWHFIVLLLASSYAFTSPVAIGAPLTTIGSFCSTFPQQCQRGTISILGAKGSDNVTYMVEVDQTTGLIPTSASLTLNSEGTPGSAAPSKALQVAGTDGTNLRTLKTDTAGDQVVVGLGTAGTPAGGVASVQGVSGGTALPVSIAANVPAEQGSLTAGSLNADLVPSTDVSTYKWYSLQVAGTWSGTLTFQGSNDNSNFVSIIVVSSSSTTNISSSTTSNGIYTGPANYKYLRVRMTAYTSGTATGTLELYPAGSALNIVGALATQNGTWNVGLSSGSNIVGKVGIDQTTPGTTNAVSATNFPTTVDTNTGAAGASTPRAVLATRHEAAATPLSFEKSNGTSFDAYGSGADGTTVPRSTLSTRHEAATTPLSFQKSNGSTFDAYASGPDGTTVPRVTLSSRHEAAATPLSVRTGNSTGFDAYGTGLSGTTVPRVVIAQDSPVTQGRTFSDSVRYVYSSGTVGTSSWVQLSAATSAQFNCIQIFDSSGQTLELGTGAAASETRVLIIPPGGADGCVPLKIAAATRLSIRALSAAASVGEIDITGLN